MPSLVTIQLIASVLVTQDEVWYTIGLVLYFFVLNITCSISKLPCLQCWTVEDTVHEIAMKIAMKYL